MLPTAKVHLSASLRLSVYYFRCRQPLTVHRTVKFPPSLQIGRRSAAGKFFCRGKTGISQQDVVISAASGDLRQVYQTELILNSFSLL